MHLPSLAAILPLLSPRQTTPDYQAYPPCTQSCFETAIANSNCQYTTEVAYVACLCNDSTSLAGFAQCVYAGCGARILNTTAVELVYNCQINGSPSSLTVNQFVADGDTSGTDVSSASGLQTSSISTLSAIGSTLTTKSITSLISASLASISAPTTSASPNADATSTKASSTTPTSTSESSSSGGGSSGLNTASLIGTIVGSITGAIASCFLAWFGWKQYKQNKEEKEEKKRQSQGVGGAASATG